jgi:hypothetical protein
MWHVAHFCLWEISKNSANIFVIIAGFMKGIGIAFFRLVWEQQEGRGCLLII